MLETPTSLRLKPVLWGKLERRSRLEAALARCEFIVSQSRARSYRSVVEETRAMEIPPEPIAEPKIKIHARLDDRRQDGAVCLRPQASPRPFASQQTRPRRSCLTRHFGDMVAAAKEFVSTVRTCGV